MKKLALILALLATPALAQDKPKDAKDFVIEALIQQRDEALNNSARLYADSNLKLSLKDAEIADLKAKLKEKDK